MVLILSLVMGACGGGDDADDTKPTTGKPDKIPTTDKDKTYTVTFDLNYAGATATPPVAQTIKKDGRATVPTQPTRTGYRLTNWYTDAATTEVFDFTTSITANITLYAGWQSTIKTVTVTFDLNYTGAATPTTATVAKDSKVTKPADPTRTGYVFDGWYKKQDGSGTAFAFDTTPITADTKLYAGWTITYTVTFDVNGGTGTAPNPQTIKKGDKATAPTTVPTLPNFTFVGWYDAKTAGNEFAFTKTPITADTKLYAGWSNNTVKLTFDTGTGASTVPVKNVVKDKTTTPPTPPTRDGYTFVNWYTDAKTTTLFAFDTTPITADRTLYAGWTIKTYTVTFDGNGGTGTTPTTASVEHGKTTTKPADPTRDGYTFDNWYDAKTGGNVFVFTTVITDNKTLYARWSIKAYTVTFDLNDGTGTTPTTASVEHGKTTTAPAAPTRDGYTFDNWYDAKTGGNVFAFATPITKAINLYARWTIKTYTVTFDGNGGTGTTPTTTTVEYGKTTTAKPTPPTRTGYTFDGWYDAKTGGNKFAFGTTTITADTKLYARWAEYSITVTLGNEAYTLTPDDKILSTVVDKTYAELSAIATVTIKTVHLPGTTNPAKNGTITLIDGRGTITVTQGGVATPYTVKLMIQPKDKAALITIINAAITAKGDTANLNFVDTSLMTDMSELFRNKTTFNGNLSEWDTANVTNMRSMFSGAKAFNQNIGGWNTAKVTNMSYMFQTAQAFNQDIGNWDTTNVTNMGAMFQSANAFNQNIGEWKTGKVTNMKEMFYSATVFNQDIGRWNTANVTSMETMFTYARALNQDISNWKTGEVTIMNSMFAFASAFDQDLSGWNVAKVTNHGSMFHASKMANETAKHPNWP